MSKLYRCLDCGKEFKFNYAEIGINELNENDEDYEKNIKAIEDYNKQVNFPMEINICYDCLKNLRADKDTVFGNNKEDNINVEETCKKCISELNKKFKEEENDLKKYSIEEEEKKINELNNLKKVVGENEKNLNKLLKELENIEEKENNFCDEFRELEMNVYSVEKNLSKSNDIKMDYENKIKSFSSSNIFTELFQISFNDKFGVINGCKFCDPTKVANYDGINAGWGYIILLTKLLAIKYNYVSEKYDLIPEGNFSKIKIKQDNNKELEIGISDVTRTVDKFNEAMVKYLEFLGDFLNYLKSNKLIVIKTDDVCPKIDGDKISDKCIKIESKEKQEDWFQSMKYLLIILKFLITQVLIQENKMYKETIESIDIINNTKNNATPENNAEKK